MKGPGVRSDQDVRRLWRCPLCDKVTRTGGQVTSVSCQCNGQRTWMRLEKTPQRPRYVPPPRELEPVEDYTLPPDPPRAEKAIPVSTGEPEGIRDAPGTEGDRNDWRDLLAAESGLTIEAEFRSESAEGPEAGTGDAPAGTSRSSESNRRDQHAPRGQRPAHGDRRDRGPRGDRGSATPGGNDSRPGQGPRGQRGRSGGGPPRPGQKPDRPGQATRGPQGGPRPATEGEATGPGQPGETAGASRGNRRRRGRNRDGQPPMSEGITGSDQPVGDNSPTASLPGTAPPRTTGGAGGESPDVGQQPPDESSPETDGAMEGGRSRKPRRRRRGGRGPKDGTETRGESGPSEATGEPGGDSFGAGVD